MKLPSFFDWIFLGPKGVARVKAAEERIASAEEASQGLQEANEVARQRLHEAVEESAQEARRVRSELPPKLSYRASMLDPAELEAEVKDSHSDLNK